MTDQIKIDKEIRQKILITLNLFAMDIQKNGYTDKNHEEFTNRIVNDLEEGGE